MYRSIVNREPNWPRLELIIVLTAYVKGMVDYSERK